MADLVFWFALLFVAVLVVAVLEIAAAALLHAYFQWRRERRRPQGELIDLTYYFGGRR